MSDKPKGKFWPPVRAMIWQKAQELYQVDQARYMKDDFTGITAEKHELREGGYFHRAKLIVLRNLWLQKKGLLSMEEQQYVNQQNNARMHRYEKHSSSFSCWHSTTPSIY